MSELQNTRVFSEAHLLAGEHSKKESRHEEHAINATKWASKKVSEYHSIERVHLRYV